MFIEDLSQRSQTIDLGGLHSLHWSEGIEIKESLVSCIILKQNHNIYPDGSALGKRNLLWTKKKTPMDILLIMYSQYGVNKPAKVFNKS